MWKDFGNKMYETGVLGAVQRDNPDLLRTLLQQKSYYGYDDLAKALNIAAEQGMEECVEVLLQYKALPDIHDGTGLTPIHLAAKRGHQNTVHLLVATKCNVNKCTFRVRATPLHWAATNGHLECVTTLLTAGALVDAQTSQGRTSLMLAARSDQEVTVNELLAAGAQVNKADVEHNTALHLAAEEGNKECVEMLLEAGATCHGQTKSGDTPLLLAVKGGHEAIVIRLLQCPDIDPTPSSHGLSALHWGAHGGYDECLQYLIPHYNNLNQQTPDSYLGPHFAVSGLATPLMLACGGGHIDTTRLFLKHGADPERTDIEGLTALFYAIKHDHDSCLTLLLDHGADPDHGQGGQMGFVGHDDSDHDDDYDREWEEEFPTGGNVTKANPQGTNSMAPLFYAIDRNSPGCFITLLRAGCSLEHSQSFSSGQYLNPLEYALCKNRLNMCLMLLTLGRPWTVILTPAIQHSLAVLLQREENTFNRLMECLSTPPLLSQQCRWQIRYHLRHNVDTERHHVDADSRNVESSSTPATVEHIVDKHIDELPVPPAMKKYLKLKEMYDLL